MDKESSEFIASHPLTFLSDKGKIVGAFYFDPEVFGKDINYRIGQLNQENSRLYEIMSDTTKEEFNEIKRLSQIKYHQEKIKELEAKH
jgi:hypothetical protein